MTGDDAMNKQHRESRQTEASVTNFEEEIFQKSMSWKQRKNRNVKPFVEVIISPFQEVDGGM